MFKLIDFNLIHECNWSCEYCNFRGRKPFLYQFDKKQVQNVLDILRPYKQPDTQIAFGGGEPGLVTEDRLDMMFGEYNNVHLCTNGLFIRNGYLKKYYGRIASVRVHIVPEITFKIYKFYHDEKIICLFVAHHKNVDFIENFILNYPELKFDMCIYGVRTQEYGDYLLTEKDCEKLFKLIDKYPDRFESVTREKVEFYHKQFVEPEKKRSTAELCRKNPLIPIFDLIDNEFSHCCNYLLRNKDRFEITKENVKKLLEGTLKTTEDFVCDHCSVIGDIERFSKELLMFKYDQKLRTK